MIGRALEAAAGRRQRRVRRFGRLSLREWIVPAAAPFDLDIREGEVVAVTGALGAGKSRLLGGLYGPKNSPAAWYGSEGRPWQSSGPAQAIGGGVFMVGEDRWRSSLMPSITPRHHRGHHLVPYLQDGSPMASLTRAASDTWRAGDRRLGIRARGRTDTLEQLSGGNQQKVVLARWQASRAGCSYSTSRSRALTSALAPTSSQQPQRPGDAATLVATSDVEEAIEAADRIAVMRDHTIVGSG